MTKINELFKRFTDDELIMIIKEHVDILRNLLEPSEKVKLAIIKFDGFNIKYIKNPSEELQLKAVQNFKSGNISFQSEFVNKYIKSQKARELFNKLNNMHKIIK